MPDDNVFGVAAETPATEAAPGQQAAQEGSPQEQPAQPDGAEAQQPDQPEAQPAPEPDDDEGDEHLAGEGEDGIRLGNKVYRDWTSADHVFRQFAGRAKAEAKRRKEAEADRDRLSAELERARSHVPASGAPPAEPAPTAKRLSERFTPDEIDSVIADKSPGAAFQRLSDLIEERVGELVEERTRDIQPLVVRNKAVDAAAELFETLSEQRDGSGNRIFPELDPADPRSDLVVQQWRENLNDPGLAPIAFTEAAVRFALTQVRASEVSQPQSAPSRPAPRSNAALMSMGRTPSPSPAAPGPTRTLPVDLEEAARAAVAARQHPVFGAVVER